MHLPGWDLKNSRHFEFPPASIRLSWASDHLSIVTERTKDIWTPWIKPRTKLRWTPEHSKQKNIPKVTEAHWGFRAGQSMQTLLSFSKSMTWFRQSIVYQKNGLYRLYGFPKGSQEFPVYPVPAWCCGFGSLNVDVPAYHGRILSRKSYWFRPQYNEQLYSGSGQILSLLLLRRGFTRAGKTASPRSRLQCCS